MLNFETTLMVVVKDDAYELIGAPTFKNHFWTKLIMKTEGISDTVSDGIYNLICRREGLYFTSTLTEL